jgi:hypothetical protein
MLTEEVSDVRRCPVAVTGDEFLLVCHNSLILCCISFFCIDTHFAYRKDTIPTKIRLFYEKVRTFKGKIMPDSL